MKTEYQKQNIAPQSTTFTITLRGNGVTDPPAMRFSWGATVTTNDLPWLTRTGHRFLGWAFSATGAVISPHLLLEGNMTLWARWEQIPSQVPISTFYMNQSDSPFSSIRFGTTTIGVNGCGLLSIAMIIARRQNATSQDAQVSIVEQIISSSGVLSGNLLSHSSTATVNGISYRISRSTTRPSNFNDTVVQLRRPTGGYHFVLAVNNSLVKDPGRRNVTNMTQAENTWGTQHAWWSVN